MSISVTNLTKKYQSQKAVDNISFEVKTGEVLGFLGPNGAGKTTTMKILTGFMAPSGGDAKVNGISVLEEPEKVKPFIGYLPESNPLYHDMPVLEYLKFVAELQNVPASKIDERIVQMVKVCGLNIEKHKKISELSKGYKQRVGLAQALIHDPKILILDEPTTGLDPNQIVEIRNLIRKIGREKTVVLSTHILHEVEATCDRILIINEGKIVADGTSDSLRKQAQGEEVLKVSIAKAQSEDEVIVKLQKLETVGMVEPITEKAFSYFINSKDNLSSREAIFECCVRNNWILTELTPLETKLEDIFRDLTIN
ncbi:MAG: gliding motility-associated ABC transporter ATP-binding subunit GldA [Ignavibacteriae bacterium]|nr:MAG: gliding motility-associated ABC transporter ATP-binding subunit GldA [Ignavibacteriota bacterium]